jgi:hypothetical protein
MALPTAILNALNAQKPALAAMYGRMVEGTYARMVRDLGPTLPGIYNNWTYARLWGKLDFPSRYRGFRRRSVAAQGAYRLSSRP